MWRDSYIWAVRRGRTGPSTLSARLRTAWVSVSAEQAGMSNNDKYSRGRAKEEAPGCLLI